VNKAEASYAGAVSQARSKLIQCLGQREAGAAAASPTLAALRKETGNKTLIPYEILAPTQAAFESINKTLAKTRIRIEAVDGAQCNQVASRIDGCWFDVSNKTDDFKGEPVTIRTGGGEATLTYTKSGRRFSGTAKGGRIDITYAIKSAAELADPHWWAGNQPPPGPVVRQAYTRYKIARKQISFSASAPDKLTGKHHGAYVRWGKTDKKMSSFETREYPARFLRGDKPKLRSIAFIDAGENVVAVRACRTVSVFRRRVYRGAKPSWIQFASKPIWMTTRINSSGPSCARPARTRCNSRARSAVFPRLPPGARKEASGRWWCSIPSGCVARRSK